MKIHPFLQWIGSGLRKPVVIYWAFAFFVLMCVQAPQLCTLIPFIVGAVAYRSYKKSAAAKAASREKATANAEPVLADMPDVDVFTNAAPQATVVAEIHDPIVAVPAVYSQIPNYDQYKEPAWKRRGIDIAGLFVLPPAAPESESTPFPLIADPDEEVALENTEESGGSFIYT